MAPGKSKILFLSLSLSLSHTHTHTHTENRKGGPYPQGCLVEQGLEGGTLVGEESACGWVPWQISLAGHGAGLERTGAHPSQVWNVSHELWLSRKRGVWGTVPEGLGVSCEL